MSDIDVNVLKRCARTIASATLPDTNASHNLVRRFLAALNALKRAHECGFDEYE